MSNITTKNFKLAKHKKAIDLATQALNDAHEAYINAPTEDVRQFALEDMCSFAAVLPKGLARLFAGGFYAKN